ncbi:MAG: hypothetical protein JXB48_19740 [Candidatus Latescibacteria bacterium]|nr:hypothetical protein [Candidatus Latescibacterota bacterium]
MAGRFKNIPYLIILCLFFAGCGGSSNNNPVDSGNETEGNNLSPGTQVVFSDAEYTKLVNAENLFARLSSRYDIETARQSLLDSLITWKDISNVLLWEDGTTVSVKFSDDNYGIVSTAGTDTFSGYSASGYNTTVQSFVKDPFIAKSNASGSDIPDTTSVLFLNIAIDKTETSAHISQVRNYFIDAGWSPSDITIKEPTSTSDYATLNPGTLTSLSPYGIIFIYAHGIYGRPVLTLYAQHYIEFCYNYKYPNFDLEQLKAWKDEGKVIASAGNLYMRADLFKDRMERMPGSFVYLCCCWGWKTKDAFIWNGANTLFGWDHIVMDDDAYASISRIARRMTSEKPAPSDTDLFEDPALVKTSVNFKHETAELQLENRPDDIYLPAWADFTIHASGFLTPISGFKISIRPEDGSSRSELFDNSGTGTMSQLVPGTNTATVYALDIGGNTIQWVSNTFDLKAGSNTVDIDFSLQVVRTYTVARTTEYTDSSGRTTLNTGFITYCLFFPVDNIITYKVNAGVKYENQLIRPAPSDAGWDADYYYTKDQIENIFGAGLFDKMTDQHLAWGWSGGGFLGYDPNDDETKAKIEEILDNANAYTEPSIEIFPVK